MIILPLRDSAGFPVINRPPVFPHCVRYIRAEAHLKWMLIQFGWILLVSDSRVNGNPRSGLPTNSSLFGQSDRQCPVQVGQLLPLSSQFKYGVGSVFGRLLF